MADDVNNSGGPLCGWMHVEDENHRFQEKRYFELDLRQQKLRIFFHPPDVRCFNKV